MNIPEFEQNLYNLLINHLNGKFNIDDYFKLLEYENGSILNYLLSHAYFSCADKENAKKYLQIARGLNSNFEFKEDYSDITVYIYYLFSTITTIESLFLDDEIDKNISGNPSEEDFLKMAEIYRENNDISNAMRIAKLGEKAYPDSKRFKYDMASNLLYTRRFDDAWEYNELRFDYVREKLPQYIDKPKFNLQKTSAKVYVYPVTKIGDTIFFARYLFKLKEDYQKLKLFVNPDSSLKTLFEQNGIYVYDKPDKSMIDYQISFEGLPYLYRENGSRVLTGGYLKADKEKSAEFKEKYFRNNKPKIGIVWKPSKPGDRRNFPLEVFSELFKNKDFQFYSLQKGVTLQEEILTAGAGVPNLGVKMNDFSDTAAVIENLDMVIGCDTSVTNLSGAMGKKTLVILPYHADWRWGLFEQKSDWYNSVLLFRQKQKQGYGEVLERVKKYVEDNLK